jgi:hypothetical protein
MKEVHPANGENYVFLRKKECIIDRISGHTVKEVADSFRRSSVTVSEAITKIEERLRKDKAFAKELKLLAENLVKGRKRKYRITEV